MHMKWNSLKVAVLFGLAMVVNVFGGWNIAMATSDDKIVAVVNNDVITHSELQQKIHMLKQQVAATNAPAPDYQKVRQQFLQKLIDRTLQLQVAKKSNITVEAKTVDDSIANIAKRNNASIAQLRAELQKEGLSYQAFRKQIEEDMIINKLQQAIAGHNITVTDKEAEEYLRKMRQEQPKVPELKVYHVVDMVVHIPDDATQAQKDAARVKAQDILTKLQKGAEFSSFPNDDKSLSSEDLGLRRLDELPALFAAQVRNMDEGDVAGLIQAPNGLHLIQLTEIQNVKIPQAAMPKLVAPTLAEAKDLAYRHKIQDKVDAWLKDARSRAYIKVMDGQ